jgi:hypothetical protein
VGLKIVAGLLLMCWAIGFAMPVSAQEAAPASAGAAAQAAPLKVPMFPLEELKPGMKGVGYTVVRGTKIEQFNVEVLELIPDGGFDGGPLVLARFSGGPIEFSGGAGQGYSGSPCYINGKLLGAISTGMPYTDTHVGGITPIQSMLPALPDAVEPDYSSNTVLPPSENNGIPVGDEEGTKVSYFTSWNEALAFNAEMRRTGGHKIGAVRCATPVLSSGLSPRVLDYFDSQLKSAFGSNLELVSKPMGKAGELGLLQNETKGPGLLLQEKTDTPPLAPGDAVAVSLMQGDLELYAVGTVTYTDDDGRILIFGHPFFGQGPTNMPLGKGYITWTYSSIEVPFKEGVRLNTLGTMTHDNSAGCGGTFNEQPDLIPVKVKIVDIDKNKTSTKRYEVIRHADFTPLLVSIGVTQAAAEALDREPGGTMKMSYHIEGVGLKEPLRRTDYYFDDLDVVSHAAMNLMPLASLLATNIYRDVELSKIEVMLEITRNRVNASIDDAEIIWNKPGEQQDGEDGDEATKTEAVSEEAAEAQTSEPALDAGGDPGDGQAVAPESEVVDADNGEAQPEASRSFHLPKRYVRLQAEGDEEQDPAAEEGVLMGPYGAMPLPGEGGDIPTFKPGEEIQVKVRLQPFHQDAVWRQFAVKIPEDFPSGNTMVVVHGGGDLVSMSELGGKGRSLMGMGPIIDVEERDLDNILTQILEWPTNNELLVTLLRPYDPAAAQELGGSAGEKPEDKVDAAFQMEYVIYNGFMLPVNIVTEDSALMKDALDDAEAALNSDEDSAATDEDEERDSEDQDGEYEMDLPF